MKIKAVGCVVILFLAAVIVSVAQDKAAVRIETPGAVQQGDTIVFNVKLNDALPKGAHFDLRISPVVVDEEVDLGSGEPVKGSDTDFRVSGKMPEGAVPGEWHIKVIWLFLPGSGWTQNTIRPNDLKFQVQGQPFAIPTSANVTLVH